MPTISVVIPVYNTEKYLHRCVNSILCQSFSDFELILVNDGSTDTSGAICDEYATCDERITVIHQTNQGQAAARNNGVVQARGEWISFVDSDDMIHPQMLEHLYQAALENRAAISMCGIIEAQELPELFLSSQITDFKYLKIDESSLGNIYHTGEHRYWVVCSKLIRADIIKKYPFTLGRVYEDNAVVFKWFLEAGIVANSLNRYYFYQVNPRGTTKSEFSLRNLDFLWALQEQIVFYDTIGFENMKKQVVAYYLKVGSWYLPKVCDLLHDRKKAAEIRHTMRKYMCQFDLDQLPLTSEEKDLIRLVTPSIAKRIKRKIGKMLKIHIN